MLAGCDPGGPGPVDTPPPEPPPTELLPADPPPPERSEASRALSVHYQRLQNDLLSQGLLRGDGGGADAPFTDTMLARNFIRIALFDEYVTDDGRIRAEQRISRLRRWQQPIRMNVEVGATVPADQAARDRASIGAYAARLSNLIGLPITQSPAESANYHVLIMNEDDRLASEARIRELAPGISDTTLRALIGMPRSTLCIVVAFAEDGGYAYTRALAVIRGEHPDVLRLACIHEEIAQGLGLANDHPQVRPSIFNDDEEFGRLTNHDELLLRILYDPRLRPGMTAAEAAPIAREIATELMGGPS
ncbi:MAG: DUF2927 domain-containing protein [Rubellimicrobium sp.]|nr:DUF2927 domain-containing protein [Rubellimicrobium sp.]